jgi:hypothetical protein
VADRLDAEQVAVELRRVDPDRVRLLRHQEGGGPLSGDLREPIGERAGGWRRGEAAHAGRTEHARLVAVRSQSAHLPAGEPLHAVIAVDEPNDRLFVVTVYRPDPRRWTDDRTRRR